MEQSTPRPAMPAWDHSDDEDRPGPPPVPQDTTHALAACTQNPPWLNPTCGLNGVTPFVSCTPISGTRQTACEHGL
jgi:hypothetical protein